MLVNVLSVKDKSIVTKAGKPLTLTVCTAHNRDGEVCKFVMPKGHATIKPGWHEVEAEAAIDYDNNLIGRIARIMPKAA